MSIGTILLIILILFVIGSLPVWPRAGNWGRGPAAVWVSSS